MRKRLRILLLEPFFGGSHRDAATGWAAHSRHEVVIESLPPRFWKWRMRGAAFEFHRRMAGQLRRFDAVVGTGLMDVGHWLALAMPRLPTAVYFHENQVAYPGRPGGEEAERDLHYAFTNLASALAADRVGFNSRFQAEGFFAGLVSLLGRMPDTSPKWAVDGIRKKSRILPLGVSVPSAEPVAERVEAPLVLWNHRWEYDKDPESFFRVMTALDARGLPFRLAVVGESFVRAPKVFQSARELLGHRVCAWGFLEDRGAYEALLSQADYVVSTAIQENFGLSIVEAAAAGCHPLVPGRLSYPEVVPEELHGDCLYADETDLLERLALLLGGGRRPLDRGRLRTAFASYAWCHRVRHLDEWVEEMAGSFQA